MTATASKQRPAVWTLTYSCTTQKRSQQFVRKCHYKTTKLVNLCTAFGLLTEIALYSLLKPHL